MTEILSAVLASSAPLLFAALGALATEYAGVLAVFMDGAINLAAFICIAVTAATGSPLAGFAAAAAGTIVFVGAAALYTEATGANPFLTGLSLNLFSAGITSLLSTLVFGTRGVVPLPFSGEAEYIAFSAGLRQFAFPAALAAAVLMAFFFHNTKPGAALRASGSSPRVLEARGLHPDRYRVFSWMIAAVFAALAGTALSLPLGAWVPNVSSGRGWTALAAVYLGLRNPLGCVLAALLFSAAEYAANILQGTGQVSGTLIMGLPYALALAVFILKRKDLGTQTT